jgi:peroxiredoxin
MTVRWQSLVASAVVFALGASAWAIPSVPRTSPEFTIIEPSGKQTLLSSFRGKVVTVEFLLTTCRPCWRASQMITKLHKELGPRGFQPIGIALNPGVSGPMVADFVRRLGITYPVGYSSPDAADSYLGVSPADRVRVPQIVVIDREGVIRAWSRPEGDPNLENESYLRNLIDTLLKEGAPAGNTKKRTSVR